MANFIGSRLGTAGVLIASEFTDRLIGGAVGIFAITVSLIAMPTFYKALNKGEIKSMEDSKKIIIATLLIGIILSLFVLIASGEITFFLMGNKPHIDNKMIGDILCFSSFQILFCCIVKLLNTIVIIKKRINIAVYSGIFSSFTSTALELFLYKKLGIYAMLIGQYGFLLVETLILTYLLMKDESTSFFLKNIMTLKGFLVRLSKLSMLFTVLPLISKYVLPLGHNIKIYRLIFLTAYGLWGLLTLILFFQDIKIFIFKSKLDKTA